MFVSKSMFRIMDDWRNIACRAHASNKELLQLANDINETNKRCVAFNEQLIRELGIARSDLDQLVYKFECLLCHATGGKLSKHTYTLQVMESVVTDYIQDCCNEDMEEAKKELAEEIFAEMREQINGYENIDVILDRMEKKYTEGKHDAC